MSKTGKGDHPKFQYNGWKSKSHSEIQGPTQDMFSMGVSGP